MSNTSSYAVSNRSRTTIVAMFVAIIVLAGLALIPMPFVIFQPGPSVNILGNLSGKKIIEVSGSKFYPAKGHLNFTTVRVLGGPGVKVTIFDLIGAGLKDSEEIFPREQVYPEPLTRKDLQQQQASEMVDSQEVAAAIALRALGREVPERVMVMALTPKSPSTGKLKEGDELVSVNGTAARDAVTVQRVVRAVTPGTPVTVVVKRKGATTSVTIPTREVEGKAAIGVQMGRDYVLPVDVKINAGQVGGPSAGTMFALATYDLLTPGELTGGKDIAGTGTLSSTAEVGPIGGIRQKMVGAREAGAEFFLAPAANCDEVIGRVPDGLRVVKVSTFTEALNAVKAISAGRQSGLPGC